MAVKEARNLHPGGCASLIFSSDNGRVLGYDNSHDYAHRHYMGSIVADTFTSYEALYERFEREWQEIAIKFVNGEQI
jgi:hypothetical protein